MPNLRIERDAVTLKDQAWEIFHAINENDNFSMTSMHVHPYYEFYFYVSGFTDIAVGEKQFTPEPYTLFIFPPGVPHQCITQPVLGRYERAYLYASRPFLQELSTPEFPLATLLTEMEDNQIYAFRPSLQAGLKIMSLYDEVIRYTVDTDPIDRLINRHRAAMLLIALGRLTMEKKDNTHPVPRYVREVLLYIHDHLIESLTVDDLAERFYISKYHLLHTFKDYTGLSIHQYILSKRLLFAKSHIDDGMNPTEAARVSGFQDYTSFYRAFVKQMHQSPQEYVHSGFADVHRQQEKK